MSAPLSILIYHRVLPRPDWLFPDDMHASRFEQHLRLLARWFHVMPLCDALPLLQQGCLPPRAACITFDDGYADNAEVALPLLQRHGLSATFFVAAGFLGGGQMWNDRIIELVRNAPGDGINLCRAGFGRASVKSPDQRRALIGALISALKYLPPAEREERIRLLSSWHTPTMMSKDQLLALHRAGMDIGAHTVSHPILCSVPQMDAASEIADGRRQLERVIEAPVRLFAYPNGKPGTDFHPCHVALVRALGFEGAVTTAWGAARPQSDPFQLPRFTPWDQGGARFLLRLAANRFKSPA